MLLRSFSDRGLLQPFQKLSTQRLSNCRESDIQPLKLCEALHGIAVLFCPEYESSESFGGYFGDL